MKDIVAQIMAVKQQNIKRYPCHSNRASSIGYYVPMLGGCLRKGVYDRTRWQDKEMHDARVQLIFDEGNMQEKQVLKDLAEADITIVEQQTAFSWKEYQITGTVDGKYIEDGVAYPFEIKSMSPMIFDTVFNFEDFKKKPWTRAYMAQITLYMLLQGIDKGIFLLKNKSNGQLKQITVDLDYELGEACLKACEEVNTHVKNETLPERIQNITICKDCGYKTICCPEIQFGLPLKINDDPMFEQRVDKYLSLKEVSKECDNVYEIIREESKAQSEKVELNILVGKYHLTGKPDSRGAFRLSIETV
jgi:CRISPR/Cas system-associated exonuclease Cas4 (RecB family)